MPKKQVAQVLIPQDLPGRMVSLARVLARLPDGEYTVELTKSNKRVHANIVQSIPVKQIEFNQDDQETR